jgi:rhodanese-related sulfurtransferase
MATSITVAELKTRVVEEANIYVLDVRRKTDYEKMPEMIPGAVWYDPENVEVWSRELLQNQDVVVYCVKGGIVSQSVAEALEKSHPGVRFLNGGILKWREE